MYVFSPLEIGTSLQTSELEIVEDKRAARQVEEIYEGKLLQKYRTHQLNDILGQFSCMTYIAGEVLLLAQDSLIPV